MYKNERKYEYKMSKDYANMILKLRKKENSKLEPQAYLCKFVNEHCGMMGTCVSVLVN